MSAVQVEDRRVRRAEWKGGLRVLLALLLVAAVGVFAAVNTNDVNVDYVIDEVNAALWVVIAISAGVGLIVGMLLAARRRS
jgi:uncharacterized integral membrane protein